jgi:two-component system, LytTR family, response regulator
MSATPALEHSPAIRTLIVDDEPLARAGLRARLEREPDVEICGEAVDGPDAVHAIEAQHPDLVFLDIQMPGCDGFEVLERVAGRHLPVIVFVTAHDEYALRAFDVHALDYLLKPYTASRFAEALRRARTEVARAAHGAADGTAEGGSRAAALARLLDERASAQGVPVGAGMGGFAAAPLGVVGGLEGRPERLMRFPVRDGDRFLLLRTDEVEWVEAAANYARLFARGQSFLVRMTMSELERRLDPEHFQRIHRSWIVNLDRVKEIRQGWHGDYEVVLQSGRALRMSRGYKDRLLP